VQTNFVNQCCLIEKLTRSVIFSNVLINPFTPQNGMFQINVWIIPFYI